MHEELTIVSAEVEKPEPTERRKKLVSSLQSKIKNAKKFHDKAFKNMIRDMDAALNGFDDKSWSDDQYVANILQRHVQQRTAQLYAKNPKDLAKRRTRMDYEVWDGDEDTLKGAFMQSANAAQQGMPIPMGASMVLQDYQNGQTH